ncbi:hypothetical protein OQA88_294 [Cercophora sp. LCS_1]
MDEHSSYFKSVRTLDQGNIDTVPAKLERIWTLLGARSRLNSHAADVMLARWLLKNMTGNSTDAERFRRYGLAWKVLGAVFSRASLFSLAQSLADRRFVTILRQTLKEISKPEVNEDSDVEMVDAGESPSSRKRKRPTSAPFEVASQRGVSGCIETAISLFAAIQTLLDRCQTKPLDGLDNHKIGAEHIKSMFSFPASEAAEILSPMLSLASMMADQFTHGVSGEQSNWVSTITSIWNLHRQGPGDISDIAIHLATPALVLMAKLRGFSVPATTENADRVRHRWERDLRHFLMWYFILPSRTDFWNKKIMEYTQHAVDISSASAAQTYPILFDLAMSSPPRDKALKKDYIAWVEAVFAVVLKALKSKHHDIGRPIIEQMTSSAAARGIDLSPSTLRVACKEFGFTEDGRGVWKLLLSIVKINPDTYLMSEEGQELLDRVLAETPNPQNLSTAELEDALSFLELLVAGYSQNRDLSTFLKTWLKRLTEAEAIGNAELLWAHEKLSEAISSHIEKSLNVNQLTEVVTWLSTHNERTESMAKSRILWAILSGIKGEEIVDSLNIKLFNCSFEDEISRKELPTPLAVSRWAIAERVLSRTTLEESQRIWSVIKPDIKHILRKSSTSKEETFAAFKCCVAVWVAHHPDGPLVDDAAKLVCSFVENLEESKTKSSKKGVTTEQYATWIVSGYPRLLSLLIKRTGDIPLLIASLIVPGTDDANKRFAAATSVLENENDLSNDKLRDNLINTVINLVGEHGYEKHIRFLLDIPSELISRGQREALMEKLLGGQTMGSTRGLGHWRLALALMVKIMGMPTYYNGLSLTGLQFVGLRTRNLYGDLDSNISHFEEEWNDLKLVEQVFSSTIRQMASGTIEKREREFFESAFQCVASNLDRGVRLITSHVMVSETAESAAAKQIDGWDKTVESFKKKILEDGLPLLSTPSSTELVELPFALEAIASLGVGQVKSEARAAVPALLKKSDVHLDKGFSAIGWEIRTFLARFFPEALGSSPLKTGLPEIVHDKSLLLQYIDAVVGEVDEKTKLGYLKEALEDIEREGSNSPTRLAVVERIIHHTKGTRDPTAPINTADFDLAQAHGVLCNRMAHASTASEFMLLAKSASLLLDQRTSWMSQWNVELSLSTVSTICSKRADLTVFSPKIYEKLCRLVEIVIKRHRIRLDGHFHILIGALGSLLRQLLSRPSDEISEEHAKLFARLLTLVCEPTDASVSRSAAGNSLDSERDRAKRYAGQYMYLVLMQCIKLQLERAVPHVVLEALQTGVYSILDITSQDGLSLMNDAMDPSGRVIFRELYKQYKRFGKWQGV